MLALCKERSLISVCRSPLGMGLLTGKYTEDSILPPDDVRALGLSWNVYFDERRPSATWLETLESIRDVLTSNGRTLAQGALAWIWARSPQTVPIPGFRSVEQVEENVGALKFGPLDASQVEAIDELVRREDAQPSP